MDAWKKGKAVRQLIGYVPQELSFYDDLGVGEAVRFFATLKSQQVIEVDQVLAGVGLHGQAAKRLRELSGGMKQRLALAIALLGDPPILVLDEVTASLDAVGRAQFVGLLSRLAKTSRRTMLFASHRPDEIQSLAARVVMLDSGRISTELNIDAFLCRQGITAEATRSARIKPAFDEKPQFVLTGLDRLEGGSYERF
jgi:ABC-type multidrug transport system ATPase subunit